MTTRHSRLALGSRRSAPGGGPALVVLLGLLGLLGQASGGITVLNAQRPVVPPVDDAASYALYGSLVDARSGGAPNAPVLQLETVVPPPACTSLDTVADAWKPAARAFVTANPGPRPLVRERLSRLPFIPVASADIANAVARGWPSFRATYKGAGGYVGVSAAGFDPGQTRAILWVTYTCGPSCGSREFRFFTKAGNSWREEPATHVSACGP